MPINLVNAQRAKGRVVYLRLVNGSKALDELVDVESYGGVLIFKGERAQLMSDVDSLHPVGPTEAAQLLANDNAASGRNHTQEDLYPIAGKLCALFPNDFKNTGEAVQLLLSLEPAKDSADS